MFVVYKTSKVSCFLFVFYKISNHRGNTGWSTNIESFIITVRLVKQDRSKTIAENCYFNYFNVHAQNFYLYFV